MANSKKPRALEEMAPSGDARLNSPSAGRNKGPLLDALRGPLEGARRVLEIASGTGEHAVTFCTALPQVQWQPSDIAPDALASIEGWRKAAGLSNMASPLSLDVTEEGWWRAVDAPIDFVLCCNMIHIAPWAAAQGLVKGAGALVDAGGTLALYGPFSRGGIHTAPSNEEFDRSLKSRDPDWGVRDIDDVTREAEAAGFVLGGEIHMPANNQIVLFRKNR